MCETKQKKQSPKKIQKTKKEMKFIHNCGLCGHVEEVVVDSNYRKQGLGKLIIDHCKGVASFKGCYKMILDCNDQNIPFYQKCGLTKKENMMAIYFK